MAKGYRIARFFLLVAAALPLLLQIETRDLGAQVAEDLSDESLVAAIDAGDTAYFRGDFDEAIRQYSVASAHAEGMLGLAYSLFEKGEYMKALDVAERAYERDDVDPASCYIVIAESLSRNIIVGSFTEQLDRRDSAEVAAFIERAPLFETGYIDVFRLGLTLLLRGDTNAALSALDAVFVREPDFAPALLLVARIHDHIGNRQRAAIFYARTLLSDEPIPAHRMHIITWLWNALETSRTRSASDQPPPVRCNPPESSEDLQAGLRHFEESVAAIDSSGHDRSVEWYSSLRVDFSLDDITEALFHAGRLDDPVGSSGRVVSSNDSGRVERFARLKERHRQILDRFASEGKAQSTSTSADRGEERSD